MEGGGGGEWGGGGAGAGKSLWTILENIYEGGRVGSQRYSIDLGSFIMS